MNGLFTSILNMSIASSVVIAVILLGRLLLKNAPKKWSYLLWIAAAFRLCCPVSIRSAFSLFRVLPHTETARAAGETASRLSYIPSAVSAPVMTAIPVPPTVLPIEPLPMVSATADPSLITANPAPITSAPILAAPITSAPVTSNPVAGAITHEAANTAAPASPLQVAMTVLTVLWLVGIAALVIYAIVDYIRLRKNVATATKLAGENKVFESENIRSPFIIGIFRPRIMVPYGLTEKELQYVLAHERYHLRRGDQIIKFFSFLLLCLHWFNPLCWLAFYLMGRDMEMSCDEKVLSCGGNKAGYSSALLSFAAGKRYPAPNPLSFSETNIKGRVKNAMKYEKPKLFVTIVAVMLCIVIVAACGTNPIEKQDANNETPDTEITPAPGNETTPEPTVEPTVEPTAAPTLEPTADPIAYWPVDIDGDGVDERLAMDLKALFSEGNQAPYIVLADGTELTGFVPISPSHAGVGTYGITKRDGKEYVLEHHIQNYSGYVSDYYTIWTLENGSLAAAAQNEIEYRLAGSMFLDANDIDAVIAYYEELNAVWRDSELAITADPFITYRCLFYDGDTSRPVSQAYAQSYIVANNAEAVHTAMSFIEYSDGDFVIAAEGKVQYRYELGGELDYLYHEYEGYDMAWDLAEKLRFNNHILEQSRNYVNLMGYFGFDGSDSSQRVELIGEIQGTDGVWTYIFHNNADGKDYSIVGDDPGTITEISWTFD
ncbi:MAG: hypothetical protein IJM20_04545 [Clostridia bacterium]|nr:hypothetical protein [Clostridia bacterium]